MTNPGCLYVYGNKKRGPTKPGTGIFRVDMRGIVNITEIETNFGWS